MATVNGTNDSELIHVGGDGHTPPSGQTDRPEATDAEDQINGGGGADIVYAGDGADFINGDAGADLIFGEEGDDQITWTSGADRLDGGSGIDFFDVNTVTVANNSIQGGDDNDLIRFRADARLNKFNSQTSGIEWIMADAGLMQATEGDDRINLASAISYTGAILTLRGLGGADQLTAFDGNHMILDGGDGRDTLTGGAGNNTLLGGGGNDVLRGLGGSDSLDGGGGIDTGDYSGSVSVTVDLAIIGDQEVDGFGKIDRLTGIENLIGSNSSDTLFGGAGVNTLRGGSGNDVLGGRAGDNRLDGGTGSDTAVLEDPFANYVLLVNPDGTLRYIHQPTGDETTLKSVEVLEAADGLYCADPSKATLFTLTPSLAGPALPQMVTGGAKADTVEVKPADPVESVTIQAGDNDLVDLVMLLVGGVAPQGAQLDTINKLAFEGFSGFSGMKFLIKDALQDLIEVRVQGDRGDDEMDASGLKGGARVEFEGNAGADKLKGGQAGDRLDGGNERDTLVGGRGADSLDGGRGRDLLVGGGADDLLTGGDGADKLEGGAGKDKLTGGAGADQHVFKTLEYKSDQITDLEAADQINLSAIDANTGQGGDQAFTVVSAFTSLAGQAVLTYSASTNRTFLNLDVDGDGKSDMTITLNGDHEDFTNFVL